MSEYLYFHYYITETTSVTTSLKLTFNLNTKIKDLEVIAEQELNNASPNIKYKLLSLSKHLNSTKLNSELFASLFFNNAEDIFAKVEITSHVTVESQAKAVDTQKTTTTTSNVTSSTSKNTNHSNVDELHFKVIDKYIFCDDGNKFAKVYLTIPGVHNISKDSIEVDFQESNFIVKIYNLNNNNYRYGVTRLHNKINPEESKIIQKTDKLIIKLKKLKEGEPWSFLHKTKMVGDDN